MRYRELPFYARSLKAIKDDRRLMAIHQAVSALIGRFEEGDYPPIGLGLKKLRAPVWEIRSSIHDRILFAWENDVITFMAAGTHEDIKRFLRSH